jgi:nicotinamidase-related amidase
MITRYDKYSCVDENLVRQLYGDTMTYIAGWETDACVLGTCFDLFDRAVPFRIVEDCVASNNEECHNGALSIMKRNFGKIAMVQSGDLAF